ncbi:MAG TPA: 16S rRNA (adenine(1518)-N(6)/adenine(1519)-N(6))-dimethyltransferase RsmA [Steroidobacteraceae bacterium]
MIDVTARRARKRFGQHFLHDPALIRRIVHAVAPRGGSALVEIGPGRGALTQLLFAASGALDVIEIDRDLAAVLREKFEHEPNFVLHEADALEFDFTKLARERGAPLRIVGNLPYNISTPLLFHLLASAGVIEDMHVMLQREVVDRLAAQPGGADYGRLTVMLAPWVHVQRLFDIGPGAFQPAPRVWSAMVRLTIRAQPAFSISPHYAAVVAAAFGQRRKTLRNALKGVVSSASIDACKLDGGARAETLAPEAFNILAQTLDTCAKS